MATPEDSKTTRGRPRKVNSRTNDVGTPRGLPPGESAQRNAVCDALTDGLVYVGKLADAADERTTLDLLNVEDIRALARLLTTRHPSGMDGSLGENTRTLWERIAAALDSPLN